MYSILNESQLQRNPLNPFNESPLHFIPKETFHPGKLIFY